MIETYTKHTSPVIPVTGSNDHKKKANNQHATTGRSNKEEYEQKRIQAQCDGSEATWLKFNGSSLFNNKKNKSSFGIEYDRMLGTTKLIKSNNSI